MAVYLLNCAACLNYGGIDLAPDYKVDEFVLPASWHGESPFVEANPNDAVMRKDWWRVFNDPTLDGLEAQAMEANPDLHAAAERFVQARDRMMKARSTFVPHLGVDAEGVTSRWSAEHMYRTPITPIYDRGLSLGGLASWEPDFWSRLRNATRAEIYRAQESAADFALSRLSIQAELASTYFELRGYDAQAAIYRQAIAFYEKTLNIVNTMFAGQLAAAIDVARAEYQLMNTKARYAGIQAKRQVAEHAIAILVNRTPSSFSVPPMDVIDVTAFKIPTVVPSRLLERRPDVAAMERRMAAANREIGVARAAFFPDISLGGKAGTDGRWSGLFALPQLFWSIGGLLDWSAFEGGKRRAELQEVWAAFRETEDLYRSTVLNAFREVEDGISLTSLVTEQVGFQHNAVQAAVKQQDLSINLYKGSLASSLDLLTAEIYALQSQVDLVELKATLLTSTVHLVRALGGGWDRLELPADDDIQPFGILQYTGLDKPDAQGGIDVQTKNRQINNDLSAPTNLFTPPASAVPATSGKAVAPKPNDNGGLLPAH